MRDVLAGAERAAAAPASPRRAALHRLADGDARRDPPAGADERAGRGRAARPPTRSRRLAARFAAYPNALHLRGLRRGGQRRASRSRSSTTARSGPGQPAGPADRDPGGGRHAWSAPVTFGAAYEGPPGCVHGGYVAAAFDEVLGATQSLSGSPGHDRPPHRRLPHRRRRCTPSCASWARSSGSRAARSTRAGSSTPGDRLCAEADGLFISMHGGKFAELKAERDERLAERGDPPSA